MGLAFESISQFGARPTFQTLISEGALSSPMFGLKLGPSGSELTIGGVDRRFKEEDFTWVKVSTEVCQASKCVVNRVSNVWYTCIGLLAGVLRQDHSLWDHLSMGWKDRSDLRHWHQTDHWRSRWNQSVI
jgi:hypothetical protein